jgi:hypothetical protein
MPITPATTTPAASKILRPVDDRVLRLERDFHQRPRTGAPWSDHMEIGYIDTSRLLLIRTSNAGVG